MYACYVYAFVHDQNRCGLTHTSIICFLIYMYLIDGCYWGGGGGLASLSLKNGHQMGVIEGGVKKRWVL